MSIMAGNDTTTMMTIKPHRLVCDCPTQSRQRG